MNKPRARHFVTSKERKTERLPWGPHDWLSRPDIVDTRELLVVRVNMPKGKSQGFHKQPSMEEVIYVLEGKAEQWVGHDVRILGPGDVAHIPRNCVHATFNVGRGVLRFLSIFGPARSRGRAHVDVSEEQPWKSLRERRASAIANKRSQKRAVAQKRVKKSGPETQKPVVRKAAKAAKTRRRRKKSD